MTAAQKLAMVAMIIGGILGLVVLGAAWATGRPRKLPYWVGGTVWGVAVVAMALTDCLHQGLGPGVLSRVAYPAYYAGVLGFPVWLAWGERPWVTRWLVAQGILLVTAAPAFVAAVASAFCTLQ